MARYLKIIFSFCRVSFIAQLEFRFSFYSWLIGNIVWMATELLTVQLFFSQVRSIAGWTRGEVFILVLTFELFLSFVWFFMLPSLIAFNGLIRKGDLDFVLSKPVNSRLWVSTKNFEFDVITRNIIVIPLFVLFLAKLGYSPSFLQLVGFLIALLGGLVVCYNFYFMVATLNIWFIKIFNLADLFNSINDMARFPADIFKGTSKLVFAYIIPTAFFSTIPSAFILGKGNIGLLLGVVLAAIVTSVISQRFWGFALKHYSSASS
jgi:ABC-2 type transport system permease protein